MSMPRTSRILFGAAVLLFVAGVWAMQSLRYESFVDRHSGRVRTHTRLWIWTFSERQESSRFTDWALGAGVSFDPPRWELRSTKGPLDHSGPSTWGGRANAFLDNLALTAEDANLDRDQSRGAIEAGLKLVEQSGPGRLVGDVVVRDGVVIISGPDRSTVWESK